MLSRSSSVCGSSIVSVKSSVCESVSSSSLLEAVVDVRSVLVLFPALHAVNEYHIQCQFTISIT